MLIVLCRDRPAPLLIPAIYVPACVGCCLLILKITLLAPRREAYSGTGDPLSTLMCIHWGSPAEDSKVDTLDGPGYVPGFGAPSNPPRFTESLSIRSVLGGLRAALTSGSCRRAVRTIDYGP